MASKVPPQSANQRIDSWKEIAVFFGRDERTVKRWEKERGLPVHRIPGGSRGSVFAFQEELTAWRDARTEVDTEPFETALASDSSGEITIASPPAETPAVTKGSDNRVEWVIAALAVIIVVGLVGSLRYSRVSAAESHSAASANPGAAAARHEAEDLYLQGRFYWNTRTPEGLTESVDYFSRATQRDPNLRSWICGSCGFL
jgi:hypothetical protein